ncbi:GDP-mannose 4,6-dehydratase [Zunongwangia sp.]|uniref:GDP-mannose 4,6-dehydratase n=1 Tax=Zunongwangia sp. TaxID=1965325 RepID=UPI003AA840B9
MYDLDDSSSLKSRRLGVAIVVTINLRMAFGEIDIRLEFKEVDDKAYVVDYKNKNYQVEIGAKVLFLDSSYYHPTEVDLLLGDVTKSKEKLGWISECYLKDLV